MNIFIITWAFWLLSEVLLNRLYRSKSGGSGSSDKHSLAVLWTTIVLSIVLSVLCARYLYFPILKTAWIAYLGLLVIIAGILVRFAAIRTLGRFFTVDVAIGRDHRLIQKGLYKYIRHPAYSGSLLSFLGLGISMDNWTSLAAIFIPVLCAFLYRIRIEEQLLLKQKGLGYSDYKKQTKRLIPFLY